MDVSRQCISCRQLHPRSRLIRVTRSRTGDQFGFSIDNQPPLQGRSAYVCRTSDCLGAALKGKKFQRTLKSALPDDIFESLNLLWKGLSP